VNHPTPSRFAVPARSPSSHPRLRWSLVAAIFVATSLPSGAAFGASRDTGAADELFRQGQALVATGQYAVACARFDESYRLDRATGTLLNLADCQAHLHKVASAVANFRAALDELPSSDDRVAYATAQIAALSPRVPHLTLHVHAKAKVTVLRDGIELGGSSLEVSLPVDPGPHDVVVRAPGHIDRAYRVEAHEGEAKELTVEPDPTAAPLPKSTLKTSTIAGLSLVGLGVASLAVGGVTGVVALKDASAARSQCPNGACTTAASIATAQSGKTFATVSTVGFGAGIAASAVGTFLLLRRSPAEGEPSVTATVGPHSAGLLVGGTF
jgi:hypothetical protein